MEWTSWSTAVYFAFLVSRLGSFGCLILPPTTFDKGPPNKVSLCIDFSEGFLSGPYSGTFSSKLNLLFICHKFTGYELRILKIFNNPF